MLSENARGSLMMTVGMAFFTFNDACMKALADALPLFEAVFLRGAATCGILVAICWIRGALHLRFGRRDLRLLAVRTLAETGAAYFFISALFAAPLANVTAILQALPLTVTLAAAFVLGEPVGWRRWIAIGIGFVGVLLIVRPGTDGFNVASLFALVAVGCVTVRDLATRQMTRSIPSIMVALSAAIGVTLFGAAGSLGVEWQPVHAKELLQLGGATVFVIGGYLSLVLSVRTGETAAVAPFRYTSLVWALVLGFLIFGEWPAVPTLVGGAIVVATGVFTIYREQRVRRHGPTPLRLR